MEKSVFLILKRGILQKGTLALNIFLKENNMTNLAQKEILIEVELDELLENPWTYFDCNLLVNGKEVRISVDEFAENPLEWDFNPTLLSLLRRYNIGVKTIIDKNGEKEFSVPDDFESIDDIEAFLSKNDYVYKKVYAYIHSNISLALEGNCSPLFNCPFDSGVAGFLFASKANIREWYGVDRITKKLKDKIFHNWNILINEVTNWANGEVYRVEINGDIYSCYGYSSFEKTLKEYLSNQSLLTSFFLAN